MPRRRLFSWPSAVVGATAATAGAIILFGRPKDPTFHVISIALSSFRLHLPLPLPLLDLDLTLSVHVANPNLVPVLYGPSTVRISYRGSLLGSASLPSGSQPPLSCGVVQLPARLDGLEMARHAVELMADVARREVRMDAEVVIGGVARVLWMEKRFVAHVVVDPVFLGFVDQENSTETHLLA